MFSFQHRGGAGLPFMGVSSSIRFQATIFCGLFRLFFSVNLNPAKTSARNMALRQSSQAMLQERIIQLPDEVGTTVRK